MSKSGSAMSRNDTIDYAYNSRCELTNALARADVDYNYAYVYDDIGNRISSTECGTNTVYAANELNQYTSVDNFTPEFDADGNQTLVKTPTGIWRIAYNGENRPVHWRRTSDDVRLGMSYDHLGRRRRKNEQRFFYDGYLQVADNKRNAYVWNCTEVVATRPLAWHLSNYDMCYYTHDGNKNVREVVFYHWTREVGAHYEYAPFGAIVYCAESVTNNPWRFAGEYWDVEVHLAHYNWRVCSFDDGRWMHRDPLDDVELSYAYLENCPVCCFDALGLLAVIVEVNKKLRNVRDVSSDKFSLTAKNVDSFIAKADGLPKNTKLLFNGQPYVKTLEDFKALAQREKTSQYILVGSKRDSLSAVERSKATVAQSYDYLVFAAHGTRQGFDGTGGMVIEFSDGRYDQKRAISEIQGRFTGVKGQSMVISCYQTWDRKGTVPRHAEVMVLRQFNWKYTSPSANKGKGGGCGVLSLDTVRVERRIDP